MSHTARESPPKDFTNPTITEPTSSRSNSKEKKTINLLSRCLDILQSQTAITLKTATMDFSLPPTCPRLAKYNRYNWTLSSFALYTLQAPSPNFHAASLPHASSSSLQHVITTLLGDSQEDEDIGVSGYHSLIQVAPKPDFHSKALEDVLIAHVALVENDADTITSWNDEFCQGVLRWFPAAFVVVTSFAAGAETGILAKDAKMEGQKLQALLVYADVYDESANAKVDFFYFDIELAVEMLVALREGEIDFARARQIYAITPEEQN